MSAARQAGEPPHPPAARRLRARLRRRASRARSGCRASRARTSRALAQSQHRETQKTPAGRGTIFDRTGVQLAIGEQTTTVFADPQQIRNPAAVATPRTSCSASTRTRSSRSCATRRRGSSTCSASPTRRRPRCSRSRDLAGLGFYPEERRDVPAGQGRRAGDRLRGHRQQGPRPGSRSQYDRKLSGRPGSRTIVRDGRGQAIDVIKSLPEQKGADVFTTIDHTIQAQAEAVLRQTVADWGAKAATAIVLDPKTGEVLAMAQAPGYDANNASNVALGAAAQPRRHRPVRAGLDVQARDRRRRPLRGPRHARPRRSRCRTRSRSPTGSSTTRTRGRPRRSPSRRSSSTRRTSARSRSRRSSARRGSPTGSTGSASASRPASTSPARARASCCRSSSGRGRRSATSRSARASRSPPLQMASVYGAVANDGVWRPAAPRRTASAAARRSRRRSAGSCRADGQPRRSRRC